MGQINKIGVWVVILWVVSACGAAAQPTPQGPIVPTRIPTATPAPTATPDPNRPAAQVNAVFPIPEAAQITLEQPYEGSITDENYAVLLTFEGQAGQQIDITTETTEGDLDTVLILRAPDGRELARNDDRTFDNRNATLYGINLPETGVYSVVVSRFRQRFGSTTGDFTVELQPAQGGFPPSDTTRLVSYSVEQFGTLTDDNWYEVYTFQATEGDIITATMTTTGGDLDPTLRLTDAAGNEIAVNSDINRITDSNARIDEFPLPYSGYYSLVATRYLGVLGASSGQFELIIESEGLAPAGEVLGILAFNESSALYEQNLDMLEPEFGFYVGDRLDDQHGEVRVQSVLAFYLPPLDGIPQAATLNLERCAEDGLGFDAIGSLNVYVDEIERLTALTDYQVEEDSTLLGTLPACGTVDVTEAVQQAYERDDPRLHFRVIPEAARENNQTDAIILTDPRLIITVPE